MNQITKENSLPYKSLAKLQAAHTQLLEIYSGQMDEDRLSEEFETKVTDFIDRTVATGSILNFEDARSDAQMYINYWITVLRDAGKLPGTPILKRFDRELATEKAGDSSPYQGLRAFDKKNQGDFFGRGKLIYEMTEKVRRERFLAVLGLSGSGKSSVVRAGFIPALESGVIADSENWIYFDPIIPGQSPLENLAKLILPENDKSETQINIQKAQFLENREHLLNSLNQLGKTAVVTIDQFEELFTLTTDEKEQQAFVNNLVTLVKNPASTHIFILTMRSEYDLQVAVYEELQELFERSQVRVTALTAADLRKAIESPAEQRGAVFEKGLVDELVQRVRGEPAGLPLLQFTLQELWKCREGQSLTWKIYNDLGGSPKNILSNVADKIYESINLKEDQELSKRIFLRLVRPKAGLSEVTSFRKSRESLYTLGPKERVDNVIKIWEEAGLLRITYTAAGQQIGNDDRVEVTHEALIRNWEKLSGWVETDRTTLRKRILLSAAAEQWALYKNDPNAGGLYGGALLEEAKSYDDLSVQEKEFIKASSEAEIKLEERREAEIIEKAVQKDRARWAKQILIVIGFLVILSFLGGVSFAYYQITKSWDREAVAVNDKENFEKEKDVAVNEKEKEKENAEDAAKNLIKSLKNPVIKIQNGRFETDSKDWADKLNNKNAEINKIAASVGRVRYRASDKIHYASTAFLVAPNIVLIPNYKFLIDQIKIQTAFIDFRDKPDPDMSYAFFFKNIISEDVNLGMVLVEVESKNQRGEILPPPLTISDQINFQRDDEVYLVGYPTGTASDIKILSQETLDKILNQEPNVKRIQPGILTGLDDKFFKHNCFSIGGNGGSPLVSLKTGEVIGQHVGGESRGINKQARPLTNSLIKNLLQSGRTSAE